MVYQEKLYREWLQRKYNKDNVACETQINYLEKLRVNYCEIIGSKIDVYSSRKISIPYRCNFNPFVWICDCINMGNYKFCTLVLNLYTSLLSRLFFELTYDTSEYDLRESYDMMYGYKTEISYNESIDERLTLYQELIIMDIQSVFPNIVRELSMTGKLPTETQCYNWISSWKMYSKFIKEIIDFLNHDCQNINRNIFYSGTSKDFDRLRFQDFYESIIDTESDIE